MTTNAMSQFWENRIRNRDSIILSVSNVLYMIMHCCLVAKSCLPLLWPHRLQPTRLFCPLDSPGKSTGVGCHCILGSRPLAGSKFFPFPTTVMMPWQAYHASCLLSLHLFVVHAHSYTVNRTHFTDFIIGKVY